MKIAQRFSAESRANHKTRPREARDRITEPRTVGAG